MKYLTLVVFTALSMFAQAKQLDAISTAISKGDVDVTFRYRVETVDQHSFSKNALASTLRSRLSYQSGRVHGLSIGVEVDNVTSIGTDKFNSTANGNTIYPLVADPEGTDINQYFLKYTNDSFVFTAGRQRINHGNQRFVGGVAWRQNEQTFDGYRVEWQPLKKWQLDYSYIYNVNRLFGPDGPNSNAPGTFKLLQSVYKATDTHAVTMFSYWLDYKDTTSLSTETQGIDYQGGYQNVKWHTVYAKQRDFENNPESYSLDFWSLKLDMGLGKSNIFVGQESLEGDGNNAFSTPLATLHKFQGFADQFIATPKNGLVDLYVGANHKFYKLNATVTYHEFEDFDNRKLGNEVNAVLSYSVSDRVKLLFKYARYNADSHKEDTEKSWLQVNVSL